MRIIVSYLQKYFKDHFHLGLYLSVVVFVGFCIGLNYTFNIERGIVQVEKNTALRLLMMFLEMGLPFLAICMLLFVFGINKAWIKSREFWALFMLGFVLMSIQRSYFNYTHLLDGLDRVDYHYFRKVLWRFKPFVLTFLPLMLLYGFYERRRDTSKSWYGLKTRNTDFKPYAILLLLVFFGIGGASFISELTDYYPRYARVGGAAFAAAHGIEEWIAMLFYEISYGMTFLSVELFFRGFLVLGFARVLGGHAVLAMMGSYVALHFGKPVTECVSSAFGGYLLGILSFYSYRIWGGVILHVGLAWSMEFFAWLQNTWTTDST